MKVPSWFPFGVVRSGSMSPTLDRGDLVLVVRPRFEDVHVGDILVFRDPNNGVLIAHRAIERLPDGRFITKGDAELYTDQARPGPVMPPIGREYYVGIVPQLEGHPIKVPYVGAFALNGPLFRMILVAALILLFLPSDRAVTREFITPRFIFLISFLILLVLSNVIVFEASRKVVDRETYYVMNNTILPVRYVVLREGGLRITEVLRPGSFNVIKTSATDVVYSTSFWALLPGSLVQRILIGMPGTTGLAILNLLSSLLFSSLILSVYLAFLWAQMLLHGRMSKKVWKGHGIKFRIRREGFFLLLVAFGYASASMIYPLFLATVPLSAFYLSSVKRRALGSYIIGSASSFSVFLGYPTLELHPINILLLTLVALALGALTEWLSGLIRYYLFPGEGVPG